MATLTYQDLGLSASLFNSHSLYCIPQTRLYICPLYLLFYIFGSGIMMGCIENRVGPQQDLVEMRDARVNDLSQTRTDQAPEEELDRQDREFFDQEGSLVSDFMVNIVDYGADINSTDLDPNNSSPDFDPPVQLPELEPEPEVCDGVDNDLDGFTDEEVNNPCGGCTPMGEAGCFAWSAQMIQGEEGTLDPTRIVALSARVSDVENFEINGAQCIRYGSPQNFSGALGRIGINTPIANFSLIPDEQIAGRYRPIAIEPDPLHLHRPRDLISLSWEGWTPPDSTPPPLLPPIEAGQMMLTSPLDLNEANRESLRPIVEAFNGEHPPDSPPITLRWSPQVGADQVEDLSLYIGGSRSLFQRGAYRGIQHYQLISTLADDGLFELPLESYHSFTGSSVWVYLERSVSAWVGAGVHSISARAGHRVELRASGGQREEETPSFQLTAPSPTGVDPRDISEGLSIEWTQPEEGFKEPLTLSLILSDITRVEQVLCEIEYPEEGRLLFPASQLSFWPTSPGSLRQLTLRTDVAELSLALPDRGRFRESVSLILRLSDLPSNP